MLKTQREALISHIRDAVAALGGPVDGLVITLERPRQAAHGDLATNVAMQLAKPLRSAPRAVAERLVDYLLRQATDMVERAELLHASAHEMCFIARSVACEVRIEPVVQEDRRAYRSQDTR